LLKKILCTTVACFLLTFFPLGVSQAATHVVSGGESLFLISQWYGTSVARIKEANALTGDRIVPGQKLYIPEKSPAGSTLRTHVVSSGESLFLISQWYGTSVAGIKEINGLTANNIVPGQKLYIPEKAAGSAASETYSVKPGDTLFKIAQTYGVDYQELQRINGLAGTEIRPGQVLRLPNAATASSRSSSSRFSLSRSDLDLLARLVYSEARGEPYTGQVAVAAVALNRLFSPQFPNTVRDVIFEPLAFTAVADGQFWLTPDSQAYRAVDDALSGTDPSLGALYYWNPDKATSQWIWSRTIITQIGSHVFGI